MDRPSRLVGRSGTDKTTAIIIEQSPRYTAGCYLHTFWSACPSVVSFGEMALESCQC